MMKQRDAFLAALGLLLVWQILAMLVNLPILPAPVKVFTVFIDELGNGLLKHFVYSLWRVFAGMMLAVLLAVPVGLVIGGSKTMNRMFSPLIYLLYPIPKVVFVPIIILFLGIGEMAKISILFLILFFQIVVLVRDQAAGLSPQLIQSLNSLGRGAARPVPLCLSSGEPACHPDRPAPDDRDGGGCSLYYRVIRDTIRVGILHLLQWQHPAGLPGHVCRRDRHEPAGPGHVLQRGLAGTKMVQVEVPNLGPGPSRTGC